jgi:hypothetical protein
MPMMLRALYLLASYIELKKRKLECKKNNSRSLLTFVGTIESAGREHCGMVMIRVDIRQHFKLTFADRVGHTV